MRVSGSEYKESVWAYHTVPHSLCVLNPRAGKILEDFDWSFCGIPPLALPSCPLPSTQTETPEQMQEWR